MPDERRPPLLPDEIAERFTSREPEGDVSITIERRFHVAAELEPGAQVRLERVERDGDRQGWEVVVEIEGVRAGARALASPLRGDAVRPGELDVDEDTVDEVLAGFVPAHLGFDPVPLDVVDSHVTIRPPEGERRVATTVFGKDDRRVFRDTTYPWSTIGLVQTNRGTGSGVMIGPRHLLTVSHIIDWTAPDGFAADWVRFTPSFFDGGAPFGESYGIHVYWYVQEDGDGFISGNEGDFDYVVVVLDRRLGETTGWMGARGYDDDWDDLSVWSHMGYPGDLNSGQRPSWQGGFLMDGTDDAAQSILHKADVFPGQSGGPMFGFWDGDDGPRAVAVQSWQDTSNNGASGSRDLRDLVVRARTEFA